VADELLDSSAERLDLAPDAIVVRRQQRTDVFGIELLGASGEADQVDEDDRHDPALVDRATRVRDRRSAALTEPRGERVLLPTHGAAAHASPQGRSRSSWRVDSIPPER